MLSLNAIHWTAGLLEGEGCFYDNRGTPAVILGMTDKDIVTRVADLFGSKVRGPVTAMSKKPFWKTTVCGSKAAGWMMTLYPLLGERRRAKIREALSAWRARPVTQRHRTHCPKGHEYAGANLRVYKNRRNCRKCAVIHTQQSRSAAKKETVCSSRT